MKKILVLTFVVLLSLGLFGCGSSAPAGDSGSASADDAAQDSASDQTDAAAPTGGTDTHPTGGHVLTFEGKILTVEMQENPTTGYTWHQSISKDDIVFESEEYVDGGGNVAGAGGVHIFTFKGYEEGKNTITFKSFRESDTKDVIEEIFITVEIDATGTILNAFFKL